VSALDTTVDVDMKDLALDDSLLAVALLTAVLVPDDFTLTLAIGADGLETLDHRTHLSHHVFHAAPVTASALLDSALLASDTGALGADDRFLQSELRDLAAVDVFETDLVNVGDCACLLGALFAATAHSSAKHASEGAAAAAKELRKQIFSRHAAATASTALLEAFLAILVVDLAPLWVG
jgi:hypothetical protein